MIDPDIFEIVRQDDEAELVCFASGDDRYLSLFAEPLCNSIAENADVRVLVHFHAINPSEATWQLMAKLGRRSDIRVASTGEFADFSALTPPQQKVYYSVERFRRLPDVLDRYHRPVLMIDLDQMFVAPISPIMVTADVGIIQFPQGAWNILSKFSASVIYANATEGSRRFFSAVRDYLNQRLREPDAITWHLDQAALAVVYLSDPFAANFEFFNPKIMLSTIGEDTPAVLPVETIFWSITYSVPDNASKMESSVFRKFSA